MGNSGFVSGIGFICSVHPHACGELDSRKPEKTRYYGSSPRLWGTLCIKTSYKHLHRFIPTLVGNSKSLYISEFSPAVHPHACGELPEFLEAAVTVTGSSPRLWGTHKDFFFQPSFHRFIPTLVGNSIEHQAMFYKHPVHPHACGELLVLSQSKTNCIGSSPRLWGTRGWGVCCIY